MKFTPRSLPIPLQVQILFFLSGFSAPVLEVVYLRLMRYWVGNRAHALATVLCAYMGGFALGSFVLGRWLLGRKRLLALYGCLELVVGIYSTGLPRVFSLLGDCVLAPEKLDALLAETPDRSVSTDFWPHLEYSTAYYFVGSPTTMEMRRYFLSAQEFQIAPVVGADTVALAEIQKWAFKERRSQLDWVPPLQVRPTLR